MWRPHPEPRPTCPASLLKSINPSDSVRFTEIAQSIYRLNCEPCPESTSYQNYTSINVPATGSGITYASACNSVKAQWSRSSQAYFQKINSNVATDRKLKFTSTIRTTVSPPNLFIRGRPNRLRVARSHPNIWVEGLLHLHVCGAQFVLCFTANTYWSNAIRLCEMIGSHCELAKPDIYPDS